MVSELEFTSLIHTRLALRGILLHEIASSQRSLVYCDNGLIASCGSLKSGSGEFTNHPVGFGVIVVILPNKLWHMIFVWGAR
jgi:hypothetical protein